MPTLRTILLGLIAIAIAGALSVVTFRTEPSPVDLHVLERGPMEVTVNADGIVRVREVYEVAAPVAGIARRAPVRLGDRVVAGQTVVAEVVPANAPILDARSRAEAEATLHEAEAALAAAIAEIAAAEEEEAFARTQNDRISRMVDRGLSPLTALEEAARRLASAEAALRAAVSRRDMAGGSVERARAALSDPQDGTGTCCRTILAPIDGVVLRVDTLSERPVQPGTLLLAIGDPTDLEISADLLSSDAVRLPPDAEAWVERWGGETALRARLRRVDPVARTDVSALGIEEQRVDAIFDFVSPSDERPGLGDGYGVLLRIVLWRSDDVLRLPLSAAFRMNGDWAVFVEEDGVARIRAVTLGRIGEDVAEVTSGLEPGIRVILHPGDGIEGGTPIAQR
ncbi:efflux RND transporter periplasmic adaptor subunit [Jannaschia aquimarina]|uniref:MacA protein n=1 Tax=Jannaschia aquimarina TaxID=935700 RepID=A0A0D1EEM6_9RHOB|nr:HlyD family efflux transporter periplasmic adaptor subunit [Jannaschia aquimarina]KIT14325.1 Macrolide export protein MacA [Jannaschia aquimarina]SNS86128.1 HlyD family secretion protein [Jannaschia aquimarina]